MGSIDGGMLILLAWAMVNLIVCGGAIGHALRASDEAWIVSTQSRVVWLALLVVAMLIGAGPVAVAGYLIIPFRTLSTYEQVTQTDGHLA